MLCRWRRWKSRKENKRKRKNSRNNRRSKGNNYLKNPNNRSPKVKVITNNE